VKTTSRIVMALLLSLLVSSTFAFLVRAPPPPSAGISLTKTASATKVLSGSSVSYLYNATNTGETDLTGAIYDDVFGPVGSFVNLAPGGWVGFNVSHVITQNTTNVATAYGVDEYGQNVTATASAFVQVLIPTIESCDSAGVKKDTFLLGDKVYGTGSGYSVSTIYEVYVVEDVTWVDGMAIPPRVAGTATSITSDAAGDVPATLLWSNPLVAGKYDIVVDVDGDGLYYAETDALDDSDIEVTAGFFVIPEVPLGPIMATMGMFAALIGFLRLKRLRPKPRL
jgi:hypothetical protein